MTELYHLTVHIGHLRMLPRGEVDDSSIQAVSKWIRNGTETNSIFPGYTFAYKPAGANLVSHHLHNGQRVLSSVVGVDDQAQQLVKTVAAELAPYWHEETLPLPFCAVFFDADFNRSRTEHKLWFGDYERVAAWAWIEKRAEIGDQQ
ncbi:hypothetical protein KTQ42_19460 [Noviherbaspirillum sp. L7-7A]|uniref:hypothetical protein n=1 Tax=Noviherbaspirillum sp. L7-7A TaxID=2850560 RepID=UPI001C2C115B|nr:hypothetical protein [Noviherbaspirillum sp. L7-7A]MBV0881468.1 hypothetical protein [Noviherbaspirillum sp. L7-7A]